MKASFSESLLARLNSGLVDFSHLFGLASLRDPVAFSGAVLGEYGWEAEWLQLDIQIGADTLFADMLDQRSETPADRFTVWRIRNSLSLSAASRELGVTVRTIKRLWFWCATYTAHRSACLSWMGRRTA